MSPSTEYLQKEDEFNDLVIRWNSKINLVSRRKSDVYDLVDDSRIFLDYIKFSEGVYIMDLGTGGGFPGIVIKLHHPEARLVLVDSIMKKVSVVCDIISSLELNGITAICSRAEEMAKNNMFKHTFDYIVARSVSDLKDLVKWTHGLLKKDGKLITIKGRDIDDELKMLNKFKFINNIEIFKRDDKKVVVISLNHELAD